jgi:hypothetical protein
LPVSTLDFKDLYTHIEPPYGASRGAGGKDACIPWRRSWVRFLLVTENFFSHSLGRKLASLLKKTQSLQKLDTTSRIANNYTQAIGTCVFAVVVVRISTIKHMIHVVNVA